MNLNLPPPRKPSFPRITAFLAMGLAVIATAIWAVSSFIGGEKAKIIISIILAFIAIALIIWLLFWLLRKLFAALSGARARREEAKAAAPPTGATPQEIAELETLQEQLDTAVRVLRESKLARGRKPDEALYLLPWIVLLGPPESGKTTVLRACGVDFPYTTAEDRKPVRGQEVACQYWFSHSAVVLDLAGRVGGSEEAGEIFAGFLDQLKRARRLRPVDGVVITVSLGDIVNLPAAEVEALANRLRRRFDEMIRRLGVRFPIYLLFTKCDQIKGFQEFFANLRSRDRSQVWGCTISRSQRKRLPAEQIFEQEFDRLIGSLSDMRLPLLASEKDPGRQSQIYTFPMHFASLKGRLSGFAATLLQSTPYSERPIFRGFYLTSVGTPAPSALKTQEAQLKWEPGRRLGATQEPSQATNNYFLENLFPKVIFADRPLATASMDTRLRRRFWLDVAFGAGALACLTLLVGMLFSFAGNRTLIESTRLASLGLIDAGWDGRRTTDLMAMEDLHQKLEELDRYEVDGPRWTLRWGMYSGDKINAASRRVYFRRLRQAFVTPTAELLRRKLYAYSSGTESPPSYDAFYSLLKAYLMMTEPARTQGVFLSNALNPIWKAFGPRDAETVSLRQLDFYVRQLPKNEPDLQLDRDSEAVRRAQSSLSQAPTLIRVYASLKNAGNEKFQPYTLAQATGGKSLEFLTSTYTIPGVFTEAGWSSYFKNAAAQAGKEVTRDDWVLGPYAQQASGQIQDPDYARKLQDMYFAEYAAEWQKFLEGISVRPLADLTEARAALDSFTQPDSAISRLLMNVAGNTMLRKDPEKGGSIAAMFSSALATLGLATKVNREELIDVLEPEFSPLHDMVTSPDGKSPALSAQYIEVLGKVHARLESLFGAGTQWDQVKNYVSMIATNISGDEFHNGYGLTARVKQQCRTKSTSPIGPLLEQPLRQAWAAILRDAGYRLDGLWKTRIADAFIRDAQPRFPFDPGSGQDLPFSLLSQFVKPGDGMIWSFYDNELKMFLTAAEGRWEPLQLIGARVSFSEPFLEFMARVWAIRQAFYGTGGAEPSVTFDLTPEPTPGVTESLLEIDGQRLLYRNERPSPNPFIWPGKSGSPQAKLSISLSGSGERPGIPAIDGEWSFFRLLNRARIVAQSQTTYFSTWSLSGSDGRRYDVRYRLQARSVQNPFAANFFNRIKCPERVTQLPAGSAPGESGLSR